MCMNYIRPLRTLKKRSWFWVGEDKAGGEQGDGDGPGICLGDGQTEAPGVPVESGCSDELLWCMLPYLML